MVDTSRIRSKEEDPEARNNFFSLLPKIDFKFPPFFQPKPDHQAASNEEAKRNTSHKPERVRFAEPKPETPPPLKLEVEEPAKISHPLIVLPVYALGGFFILKWVWARWKERAKKASDDDKQSPDAHQSPAEDGEGFC